VIVSKMFEVMIFSQVDAVKKQNILIFILNESKVLTNPLFDCVGRGFSAKL
jgi:hypothetical protein